MFRDDNLCFREVFCVLDLEESEIEKDEDARGVESKQNAGFFDVGNCEGINSKADRLSCS
jgi:hypothetical protein